MNRSEKQIWIVGIAGSLAVHLTLLFLFAMGLRLPTKAMPKPTPPPEPEITVVMATTVPPPVAKKEEAPPPEPPKPKPKKVDRYIRTTQNEDAKEAPKNPAFESDRNTVAASKNAPAEKGDPNMPNTKGVDQPTLELANREFHNGEIKQDSAPVPQLPASKATPPAPKPPAPPIAAQPKPQPPPQPVPAPKPPEPPQVKKPEQEIAKKDDSAAEKMLREAKEAANEKNEPPKPKMTEVEKKPEGLPELKPPSAEPLIPHAIPVTTAAAPMMRAPTLDLPPPAPSVPHAQKNAFMPQTRVAKVKGTISNRGAEDTVDAAATPTGKYMQKVMSAIELRWQYHCKEKADFTGPGKMRIHFYVNKDGKPEDIRFVFSEANAVCVDFTLSSILEAKIPPIPADLLPMLDKERFELEPDFVIY